MGQEGVLCLKGFADDSAETYPYFSFRELFRNYCKLDEILYRLPNLTNSELANTANKLLPFLSKESEGLLPFLMNLIGISFEEQGMPELHELNEKEQESNTHKAVREWLFGAANYSPVIVHLDNLQWADQKSLDLFVDLFDLVKTNTITLIGTYRPERDKRCNSLPEEVQRRCPEHYHQVTLNRIYQMDGKWGIIPFEYDRNGKPKTTKRYTFAGKKFTTICHHFTLFSAASEQSEESQRSEESQPSTETLHYVQGNKNSREFTEIPHVCHSERSEESQPSTETLRVVYPRAKRRTQGDKNNREFIPNCNNHLEWEFHHNRGGIIEIHDSSLFLASHIGEGGPYEFPFVRIVENPFPKEGNFAVRVKMQYLASRQNGGGFEICSPMPQNNTDNLIDYHSIASVWQDNSAIKRLQVRLLETVFCLGESPELEPHQYEFRFFFDNPNTQLQAWVDGKMIGFLKNSFPRPDGVWFGNFQPVKTSLGWSDFRVDWVEIIELE
jgi:hypothetical protein